jgi:CBS domain-containing protein
MTPKLNRRRPLTVGEVMTAAVVTVGESATFHEMALLMKENMVSALPVVGADGRLLGIVSQADLLLKQAAQSEHRRPWPESREHRSVRTKSEAVSAAEVMTHPVVTVTPGSTVATAARLMQDHNVKRLPVVDETGSMVGIASRGDLLTAFTRSDEQVRSDIVDGILPGWLGIDPDAMTVCVDGGVVSLRGSVDCWSDVKIVEHAVAALDGVVGVDAHLGYQFDDRHVTPAREGRIR